MKSKIYILLAIILAINSCTDYLEPKEYISIYIVNHTGETIFVYTVFSIIIFGLPSTVIPSGSGQAVLVEKGQTVTIHGKDSGSKYGSKSFYIETQWDIY
jgi:hypothetical protein